ncbi:MAG TPA: SDR family oxidoreductase, partial [Kribbella sp.]|nr:SDR family oxidoreductase [Kribbella sp.]
ELGPRGITVNSVAPGYIADTAFHNTFSTEQAQAAMVAGTPIGRPGQVEDVANAVRFLALPASGYLTGITIDIDGGTWPR